MVFVLLDEKDWCRGVYHAGKLHFSEMPNNISKTWRYTNLLENKNIEYASIYAQGKTLEQVCPNSLKKEWQERKNKLKAFYNSFVEAKVSLEENCFYDLVPHQFLLELCEIKTKIIEDVFLKYKRPDNYNFLLEVEKILLSISSRKLNIDLEYLNKNKYEVRARTLMKTLKKSSNNVVYNPYGSKTGRLTTFTNTFPILNLDTKYKSIIKPTNDLFVELDYNSAEARVLISLAGLKQPSEDIHTWNAKRLSLTREEAKTEFFAWLYGSSKVETNKYSEVFKVNRLLETYYNNGIVTNPYGRKIESDQFHSMNYLIQSTTNDLVLRQIIKINNILKRKKSFISFIVHDSLVLDLAKEDTGIIRDIIEEFAKTDLDRFPVNVSAGKDYGNLRKIKCL